MNQLTADQAATFLGVRKTTLYAYVARGTLRSYPANDGTNRYQVDDLERLRSKKKARAGKSAMAAEALRFGAPVLDTSITEVGSSFLRYRGHDAAALARSGASFEQVAELLWTGSLPKITEISWVRSDRPFLPLGNVGAPLQRLALLAAMVAQHEGGKGVESEIATCAYARSLIPWFAAGVCATQDEKQIERAYDEPSVARILLHALGRPRDRRAEPLLNRALILTADHELNASTFTARIAASTVSDTTACLTAALATASGPRHIAAANRFERFVQRIKKPADVKAAVREQLQLGEDVPCFGHSIYKQGDPRAAPLLEAAFEFAPRSPTVKTIAAVIDEMAARELSPPTVDVGLVAICAALNLPSGSAPAIFAIGRMAGWIAHIMEQRATGYMLRPRAHYIGQG